ncbi:hypothetical protein [Bacillus massiliglaciei]|uniref:hypothetical protein n=1 Tax=Bacillus massiliglaciei TaxID=1816693 RepID=UPI000DA61A46|nr:hypothetical protein [Bacillus massiliglaciei]
MVKEILFAVCMALTTAGCGDKIPEPENIAAAAVQDDSFTVKTAVSGNKVYIECHVKKYSFSSTGSKPLAAVLVYVDGKLMEDKHTAAFVLKNLPQGKHVIKLVVVNQSGQGTGMSREFNVHIHSRV